MVKISIHIKEKQELYIPLRVIKWGAQWKVAEYLFSCWGVNLSWWTLLTIFLQCNKFSYGYFGLWTPVRIPNTKNWKWKWEHPHIVLRMQAKQKLVLGKKENMALFQTANNTPRREVSLIPATCKHLLVDNGEAMISLLHPVVGMSWLYLFI